MPSRLKYSALCYVLKLSCFILFQVADGHIITIVMMIIAVILQIVVLLSQCSAGNVIHSVSMSLTAHMLDQ